MSDAAEEQRRSIVLCPICGVEGEYTYGGVLDPWSKDNGKKLTELSNDLNPDGRRRFGHEHTSGRCIASLRAQLRALAEREEHATTYTFKGPGGMFAAVRHEARGAPELSWWVTGGRGWGTSLMPRDAAIAMARKKAEGAK